MTMRVISFLFLLTTLFSCGTKKKDIKSKDFSISVKSIKGDTIITNAVYFEGHILCLKENNKILVLDTSFDNIDSLTDKFSNLKIDFIQPYNDTILISTEKDIFYLDTGFVLKKYNRQFLRYQLPYYNDSTYYVYACSAGEWGGAIFFLNKKTNKTYSYPATCVQQVLTFNNTYIVSNFLAHLSGLSDYLSIKDPQNLYELKNEKQKTFCNWYMQVDSIKDSKLFDAPTPPGVKYYADTFTTRNILTFTRNNNLYSIYCTDSATILAKHEDFKLKTVDTLLNRPIDFHHAKTHLTKNIVVTSYEASWSTYDSKDKILNYQNTGLIFIKDNNITFLEFKTPHMWANNNGR
jgi:hypothetical protein